MTAMKIVICGSRRFHDGIRKAAQRLRENGHIVLEPILNRNKDINNLPADLKRYAFLGLTHHQLDLIRKADVCLVFNEDGYAGNSTTLELGYAVACGLVIYALEEDREEPCRDVLFDFVVGSIDEFVRQIAA